MPKRVPVVTANFVLLATVALVGCSPKPPSEADIYPAVTDLYACGVLEVDNVKKVDGIADEHGRYMAEFTYDVKIKGGVAEAQRLLADFMARNGYSPAVSGCSGLSMATLASIAEYTRDKRVHGDAQYPAPLGTHERARAQLVKWEQGWRVVDTNGFNQEGFIEAPASVRDAALTENPKPASVAQQGSPSISLAPIGNAPSIVVEQQGGVLNISGSCGSAVVHVVGVAPTTYGSDSDSFEFDSTRNDEGIFVAFHEGDKPLSIDRSQFNKIACVPAGDGARLVVGTACGGSACTDAMDYTVVDPTRGQVVSPNGCDINCASKLIGSDVLKQKGYM